MDPYITALYQIVAAGQKTNSYKFALWRALAHLAPTKSRISKLDFSPLFVEYYWPLEVKYHLRQGIDPDKDPIVMRRIRELLASGLIAQGEPHRDFQKRNGKEYEKLIAKVAAEAFDDVIPRFHVVRGAAIDPKLFTFTGKIGAAGSTIELTAESRQFLINYRKLVEYVAVSGWVRFTEDFTSAPKLHDKIGGTNTQRRAVSQWRKSLMEIQSGKCFYDESHEMLSPEVDHVLPWSFVLEDKTWNLVLACRKCNNDKRDRLTDTDALQRLCGRNERIIAGDIEADTVFSRHFAEWRLRDLSLHIRGLYDQAAADGFPFWL
jgi:HNH endonuclease